VALTFGGIDTCHPRYETTGRNRGNVIMPPETARSAAGTKRRFDPSSERSPSVTTAPAGRGQDQPRKLLRVSDVVRALATTFATDIVGANADCSVAAPRCGVLRLGQEHDAHHQHTHVNANGKCNQNGRYEFHFQRPGACLGACFDGAAIPRGFLGYGPVTSSCALSM